MKTKHFTLLQLERLNSEGYIPNDNKRLIRLQQQRAQRLEKEKKRYSKTVEFLLSFSENTKTPKNTKMQMLYST
jgi:hypothetical protein